MRQKNQLQGKTLCWSLTSVYRLINVHSTTHVQLRCQGLSSSALYSQGRPTVVGLFKPQSPHYKCGTFAAMLTWRSCTEFTLRHTVQRNWFMPLVNALNWLMRSWVYICLKTGLCFPNLENKEPKSNQDAKSKEGRQFLQLGADLSTVIDRGILINQPRSSEKPLIVRKALKTRWPWSGMVN